MSAPDEVDGDGVRVAQGAVGDAVAAVLGGGGLRGDADAAAVSGLLYLPVGAAVLWLHQPTAGALLCALAAGVLSSAVPFLADLVALRRVPAHFFGIFMSVNPVFAALVGMLVLGQHLDPASWLAIAAIVTANAVAVGTAANRSKEKTACRGWRASRRSSSKAPPRSG